MFSLYLICPVAVGYLPIIPQRKTKGFSVVIFAIFESLFYTRNRMSAGNMSDVPLLSPYLILFFEMRLLNLERRPIVRSKKKG